MKNRGFTLEDIKEMVQQGIVASKESESLFYGRWETWRKDKDARDQIMHDDILLIKTEVTSLREKVSIQNGRVSKSEKQIDDVKDYQTWQKGGMAVFAGLLVVGISLVVYVLNIRFSQIEKQYDTVAKQLKDNCIDCKL